MIKLICTSILTLIILSGCATSYQPNAITGGYSETQLSENSFSVNFRGNGYTSRERVEDFTLLRSSELALKNGFNYFVLASDNIDYDYSVDSYSKKNYDVTKYPTSSYKIICFKEKPSGNIMVYSAEFISKNIKDKYSIK